MKSEGNNDELFMGCMDCRHPVYTRSVSDQRELYDAGASWHSDSFILADHAGNYASQCISKIHKRITDPHAKQSRTAGFI
jgi:hypothetical protein